MKAEYQGSLYCGDCSSILHRSISNSETVIQCLNGKCCNYNKLFSPPSFNLSLKANGDIVTNEGRQRVSKQQAKLA